MLGVLVALLASLGLPRLIANMVFHRNSYDALTFVSVAVILFAAALIASCIPARCATRVGPMIALRYE